MTLLVNNRVRLFKIISLISRSRYVWLFLEKKSKIFPMKITLGNQIVISVDGEHEFFLNKLHDGVHV